jgi:hypothetical protein
MDSFLNDKQSLSLVENRNPRSSERQKNCFDTELRLTVMTLTQVTPRANAKRSRHLDSKGEESSPLREEDHVDIKLQTNGDDDEKDKKEFDRNSNINEEEKQCLSRRQRLACIFTLTGVFFLTAWLLHPFERIIDAFTPQFNNSMVNLQRTSEDPTASPAPTRVPFDFLQCDPERVACCNGLENICDMKINEIMFATVHNAMATKEDGFLLNPSHRYSLESALEAGYRGIHLEVCKCNGVYEFCHGICHLGARDPTEVFLNIDRFLRDNPQEVLLMKLQINNEVHQQVDLDELYELMGNATHFASNLYVQNYLNEEWPTLRAMINKNQVSRDKRLSLAS